LGPNTGALAPSARAKCRAGCWVREESPPPAVRVRGYHPRKICENSDAKSCMVTLAVNSCFSKTTAKNTYQYIGPVSPGPYGCCAYMQRWFTRTRMSELQLAVTYPGADMLCVCMCVCTCPCRPTCLCLCLRSEWLEVASHLYNQVCEAHERLSLAADDRAVKLERCVQLRQFEDTASTVCLRSTYLLTNTLPYCLFLSVSRQYLNKDSHFYNVVVTFAGGQLQ